jgi:hypothetical protein
MGESGWEASVVDSVVVDIMIVILQIKKAPFLAGLLYCPVLLHTHTNAPFGGKPKKKNQK